MKYKFSFLISLAMGSVLIAQQNVSLDQTFGQSGFTTVHQKRFESIVAMVVQPDQKMVAVGFTESSTQSNIAVLRYSPDGSLDPAFADQGVFLTKIFNRKNVGQAVAIQPDGKILVAGYFLSDQVSSYREDLFLLRLTSDGVLDSTFSEDGIITRDFGRNERAVAVQADLEGNIFLAVNSFKGNSSLAMVLGYLSNGVANLAFGNAGVANCPISGSTWNHCNEMEMLPNGNLVLALESRSLLNAGNFAVFQMLPSGLADSGFSGDGALATSLSAQDDIPMCITRMADGKLMIGGLSIDADGRTNVGMIRLLANGNLDVSFNNTGKLVLPAPGGYGEVARILPTPDGQLLLVGTGRNDCLNFDLLMAKIDQNGDLDETFGENGFYLTDYRDHHDGANDAFWLPNGKLMVAGTGVDMHRSFTEFLLARFNFDQNVGTGTPEGEISSPVAYPNPTTASFINFQYTLKEASEVSIELFSISGGYMGNLFNEMQAPGLQTIQLSLPAGLPKGQYLASIQTASERSFVKIILQ